MIKEIGITKLLIIGACGIILVALPTEKSIKNKEVVNNITKNIMMDPTKTLLESIVTLLNPKSLICLINMPADPQDTPDSSGNKKASFVMFTLSAITAAFL